MENQMITLLKLYLKEKNSWRGGMRVCHINKYSGSVTWADYKTTKFLNVPLNFMTGKEKLYVCIIKGDVMSGKATHVCDL